MVMVVTRCNYHCAVCTLRSWTLRACAVLAASALQSTELGTVGTCRHLTWQLDAEPRIEHTQGRGDGMAATQQLCCESKYNLICIINIELLSKDTQHTFHRIMSSCPSFRSEASLRLRKLKLWEETIIDNGYYWVYRGWFYIFYCHVAFDVYRLRCPRPVPCHHHVARCQVWSRVWSVDSVDSVDRGTRNCAQRR